MSNNDQYLSISGDTKITGTSFLPGLGVRRAYIEGTSFENDKLIDGEIKHSEKELPPIEPLRIQMITEYLSGKFDEADSVVLIKNLSQLDSINHPFSEPTLLLYLRGDSVLSHINLVGNIILFSEHRLTIDKTCRLKNCIVVSRSVNFNEGFTGSCQAFATDSLRIGGNCKITYPGFLGIINPTLSNCYMYIEGSSEIEGGILVYQKNKALKKPHIHITENTIVKGIVYCTGTVEQRGTIHGTLYCEGFLLKTERAFYENHILNAVIDCKALSEHYLAPLFFNEETNKKGTIAYVF